MAIEWHDSVETLLEGLTDEAQVRSKLHMKQHMSYRRRNQAYTLPVIILSVLSGSGNFVSDNFTESAKQYIILGVGAVSIIVSVISSINQFLKLAQLEESNRIASIQWGKFFSRLKFQLYLLREDRETCHDFLLSVSAEYERLYEISPPLLDKFIKDIKRKFKKRQLNGFVLPFYMNGFVSVNRYGAFEDNTDDDKQDDDKQENP